MKSVYQTILLLILIVAMCFAGCSPKYGCPASKVLVFITLHPINVGTA